MKKDILNSDKVVISGSLVDWGDDLIPYFTLAVRVVTDKSPIEQCKKVFIIWSDDSNRTGLIVDGECWGIFDLSSKRKLNSPREKNMIVSIERQVWDNGIRENEGEALRLDNN